MPSSMPPAEQPKKKTELTADEEAQYERWMQDHPEVVIAPEDRRECGPEIAEFETMLTAFESEQPLAELYAIIDLTPEDAAHHAARERAKAALEPISAKLTILKDETDISEERFAELKKRYKKSSNAIGFISKDKVDHTR